MPLFSAVLQMGTQIPPSVLYANIVDGLGSNGHVTNRIHGDLSKILWVLVGFSHGGNIEAPQTQRAGSLQKPLQTVTLEVGTSTAIGTVPPLLVIPSGNLTVCY